MSFRLWLKGRKTAPRKTKNPGEFTYPSMNIGRERAFYMGLTFCIIMIIGLAFLLYPLYAYTPVGLRPASIMDAEGLVMFPKESAWGYFFGSDLLSITLDITDTPSISELPLDITNYSDNYKTLTYEVLTQEFGMGPYKARALSYFAWTIGEGQEVAWGAWQGIAVPVGLTMGDFLSSVFGPTWDILAASTITAPWKQYFLSIMFTTTGFAIMFAIWIDPVRRRGMSKIHKKISGIKQRFTYGMNDRFNIKVRKSQPWTTIAVILMLLTYYLAFYKKYFMGTNNLIFEGLQSIFWISAIASVLIFYQTFVASKHLGTKPGKRGPKAKLDKQIEKDSKEFQEIRADRDIFRSEARRGMFSGWNLSRFMGNNYDGNKDANELAGRMLGEEQHIEDPYGNPVHRQRIVTPSGRTKEGVISTKVDFGDGVKRTYHFNSYEDKERFRETAKLVVKNLKESAKDQATYKAQYGPIIDTLKRMGYSDTDVALKEYLTTEKFKDINNSYQILRSKGLSPEEANAESIRLHLDKKYKKGLEFYDENLKGLKQDKARLTKEAQEAEAAEKERQRKLKERTRNAQARHGDDVVYINGQKGNPNNRFLDFFKTDKEYLSADTEDLSSHKKFARDSISFGSNIIYITDEKSDKIIIKPGLMNQIYEIGKAYGKKYRDIDNFDEMGDMLADYKKKVQSGGKSTLKVWQIEDLEKLIKTAKASGASRMYHTNRGVLNERDNPFKGERGKDHGVIRIGVRNKVVTKKSNYSISKPKQKKKRRWI